MHRPKTVDILLNYITQLQNHLVHI